VLTSQTYLARLQEAVSQIGESARPRLMPIDRILDEAGCEDNPCDRGLSEHLAYVIYTSGSTGVPKGAMVTRRGMFNNIRSKVSGLKLGPADVIAQTASQCFDISVWQFLTALTCGARTSIVPDETSRDPFRLITHLERTGITILETVPALLQGLLDAALEAGSDTAPRLQHLRWVLPTGEALPPPVCRQWLTRYPAIPLLNAYGPAECADDVAVRLNGPACTS
jgi:non-ribosomal peptide synthetase component F